LIGGEESNSEGGEREGRKKKDHFEGTSGVRPIACSRLRKRKEKEGGKGKEYLAFALAGGKKAKSPRMGEGCYKEVEGFSQRDRGGKEKESGMPGDANTFRKSLANEKEKKEKDYPTSYCSQEEGEKKNEKEAFVSEKSMA